MRSEWLLVHGSSRDPFPDTPTEKTEPQWPLCSGVDPALEYYQHEIYFGQPNLWPEHPEGDRPKLARCHPSALSPESHRHCPFCVLGPATADFEAVMTKYYKEMEQLTLRLLAIVATVLRQPGGFFDDKMSK